MSFVGPNKKVTSASLIQSAERGPQYAGLDRIGQRLARGLAEFLTGLMGTPAKVSAAPVSLDDTPADEALVTRQLVLGPTTATLQLAVSRGTLMRLVDLYYGGDGALNDSRETLSPAEDRFFTRLSDTFANLIGAAWQPAGSIEARVDANAVPELAVIAIQIFSIEFVDGASCALECRYPLPTLEAFPELQSAQGEHFAVDHNWQAHLMGRALDVKLPVRAVFAEPEVALERLLDLRPGDIIPVPPPTTIELTVAGLPFARGNAGESNGRAAICIDHL